MCLSLAIGICLAWPLVRLSGPNRAWPIRQSILDVVVLLSLAQVVVWPLRLVTPWVIERSVAIDLCIVGWALAVTAMVALGTIAVQWGASTRRVVAMTIVVVMIIAAPTMSLYFSGQLPFSVGESPSVLEAWRRAAEWSPLTAIHALSAANPKPPSDDEWRLVWGGWWVAIPAWSLVFFNMVALRRTRRLERSSAAG